MKGARIKQLREEKGLTQIELADKLKISNSTIAMYETNKREPSDDMKLKMCELFDCSLDYLVGRTNIRNPQEINIDEADIAFASGVKGLNETNKMIIKSTLEALLAKQEKEEKGE